MRSNPSSFPYEKVQKFQVELAGQEINYFSKPGLPDWDQITPSTALLGEKVLLRPGDRALLLGSGNGALGPAFARQLHPGELWLADTSFIALEMSRRTLQANSVQNARILAEIDLPQEQESAFDVAILQMPKGRKLAQRWLVAAHTALRPGGSFYIAGANKQGVQPVIRDAESLFGPGSVLGYKKGNRVVRLSKSSDRGPVPDWAEEPGVASQTWVSLQVATPAGVLDLHSLPGIFSYDRLDEGTDLLLGSLKASSGETVLDMGCGVGILGLAASIQGAARVDLADVNLLAVAAARENIFLLDLQNAQALPSDCASAVIDRRYSLVLSNPPFHTGKAVDYAVAHAFITQASQVLSPGGRFMLVANQFIPYEALLKEVFGRVERLAETSKYRVYQAH